MQRRRTNSTVFPQEPEGLDDISRYYANLPKRKDEIFALLFSDESFRKEQAEALKNKDAEVLSPRTSIVDNFGEIDRLHNQWVPHPSFYNEYCRAHHTEGIVRRNSAAHDDDSVSHLPITKRKYHAKLAESSPLRVPLADNGISTSDDVNELAGSGSPNANGVTALPLIDVPPRRGAGFWQRNNVSDTFLVFLPKVVVSKSNFVQDSGELSGRGFRSSIIAEAKTCREQFREGIAQSKLRARLQLSPEGRKRSEQLRAEVMPSSPKSDERQMRKVRGTGRTTQYVSPILSGVMSVQAPPLLDASPRSRRQQ